MSREKPKEIYIDKPKKFGNGARIKSYKKRLLKRIKTRINENHA